MTDTLGEMVRTAMALHQRYAARAAPIIEGFVRVADADGNTTEAARWRTILKAVQELERS